MKNSKIKNSKKAIIFTIVVAILCHGPIGGFFTQTLVSVSSYVGICIGSLFSTTLREDMSAINYNPFNNDENKVVDSKSVSFYKGIPIYRTNNNRSGSFCAILLSENESVEAVKHESGHNVQQLILGPLTFLIDIGIPSMFELSTREYYDRPWEITADMFGGVSCSPHSEEDMARGKWYLTTSLFTGPLSFFFLIGEY